MTIESVLPVLGRRYLAIVDRAYLDSTGRYPALPGDSDSSGG